MPIYEYQCTSCGHKLEAFQKISDELLRDCPACNQPDLKKCVTAAAFKLKGTGWYETDFKKPNQPEKKPAESGGKAESKKASTDKASSSAATKDSSG